MSPRTMCAALYARFSTNRAIVRPHAAPRLRLQRCRSQRMSRLRWVRESPAAERRPAMSGVGTEMDAPGPARPRRADEFDAVYASETPPWDIGRPQQAFLRLAETGELRGRVLDAGCGTGEHALMAAALGLETVGIDAAPNAIAIARRKAEERALAVRFAVADALDLPALATTFDTVLDCGLFHIFDDGERVRYVDSLRTVLSTGGRYHMLCFSDRQPGDWGPRRVRSDEIVASFADGWRIDSIEPATLEVNIDPDGVIAWLATVRSEERRVGKE